MVSVAANLGAFSTLTLLRNVGPEFEDSRFLPIYTALSTQRVTHGVIQVATGL